MTNYDALGYDVLVVGPEIGPPAPREMPLPDGPWSVEPSRIEWRDRATRLPCMILRGPMGSLCGYVGVYRPHPLWGKRYSQCLEPWRHRQLTRKRRRRAARFELRKSARRAATDPAYAEQLRYGLELKRKLLRLGGGKKSRSHWKPRKCWSGHQSPEDILEVHGGITYADRCAERICHTPRKGEPPVWWFGFDCGHADDVMPAMVEFNRKIEQGFDRLFRGTYKPVPYVVSEIVQLARQLASFKRLAR